MEEQTSVTQDATPSGILGAAMQEGAIVGASTEQQEVSTEAPTEVAELTEEANNTVEGEIPEAEAATEDEAISTEATEDNSSDSNIVNLNIDDNTELTNENEEVSTQTTGNHYGEMLDGEFENEEDLSNHLFAQDERIEELEGRTPEFANDYVKQLNDHVLAGGSAADFVKVQGVNVEDMNTVETLVTELMWNNKGLSKDKALSYLEDKFPNSLDDDGNLDPENASLIIDANKAAKVIKEIQAEDKLVPQTGMSEEEWNSKSESQKEERTTQAQEADNARMEEWMQPVEDELGSLKANGLVLSIGEGEGLKYPVKMDDSYADELIGKVDQALMRSGTSIKDSPKAAKELVELFYIQDNLPKILKAAVLEGSNSVNKEWLKKVNNPSVISRGDEVPTSANTAKSPEEQFRNFGR